MTIVTAKFINTLFLRNLLESRYGQKDVAVRKHSVESKSGYVHRIHVRYSSRQNANATINLIALIKPSDAPNEIVKEFTVLNEILPRYTDALKADRDVKLFPKTILWETKPIEFIVLEDVTQLGYTAARVSKGLTIEQSRVAVQKIAALHAASVLHLKHASAEFKLMFEKPNFETNYFKEALSHFISAAESIKIPSSVVQKLTVLQKPLLESSATDFDASFYGFNVLNHGNASTNNILFSYTNGQPVDALLIDFKRAVIGSPVLDLMFFFSTSVAFDVLQKHKDELLYTYHNQLTELLKALKYDGAIPTLLDFQTEFLKRGLLELLLTLTVAPYLRTSNCAIQPKLIAPISDTKEQQVDLSQLAKQVLANHAEEIIEELNVIENNGLLDWGVKNSHVQKLLGAYAFK